MSEHIRTQIAEAIGEALPGAKVEVAGAEGHYIIDVVSGEFAGKSRLAQQRLVLDTLRTRTP